MVTLDEYQKKYETQCIQYLSDRECLYKGDDIDFDTMYPICIKKAYENLVAYFEHCANKKKQPSLSRERMYAFQQLEIYLYEEELTKIKQQ